MIAVMSQLERFFGRSQNGTITDLLAQQADIAIRCAKALRESNGKALKDIIALEHEGDDVEQKVHEIIDSAFILRFDKSDIGNLSSTLDNILDGMRQVGMHVDVYSPHITEIRPETEELAQIIEKMTHIVSSLVKLLCERRIPLQNVKDFTRQLTKLESEADSILHRAEAALVKQYGSSNALTFMAYDKLFRMLEHITDVADHCGTLVLSIARKEA